MDEYILMIDEIKMNVEQRGSAMYPSEKQAIAALEKSVKQIQEKEA